MFERVFNNPVSRKNRNYKMGGEQNLQYGSGFSGPASWRNFDASPTLLFERLPVIVRLYTKNEARFPESVEYGDIIKGLPVAPNSYKGVYCSHVLEHLSLNDFRVALSNTYKVLQPGGTLRLVLPDLEHSARQYLSNSSNDAAYSFMRETYLGLESRPHNLKAFVVSWHGNSQHLWMWDYKAITLELLNAGFIEVRRASFGDSLDIKFLEVEDKSRWDNCLGVECKKSNPYHFSQ